MQNMLEQGPDYWRWFDTIQFSYHCVHSIHAKVNPNVTYISVKLCHFSAFHNNSNNCNNNDDDENNKIYYYNYNSIII